MNEKFFLYQQVKKYKGDSNEIYLNDEYAISLGEPSTGSDEDEYSENILSSEEQKNYIKQIKLGNYDVLKDGEVDDVLRIIAVYFDAKCIEYFYDASPVIQLIALAKDYKVFDLIQEPNYFVKKVYRKFIKAKSKLSKTTSLNKEQIDDLFIRTLYSDEYTDELNSLGLFFALTDHNVIILEDMVLDFRGYVD